MCPKFGVPVIVVACAVDALKVIPQKRTVITAKERNASLEFFFCLDVFINNFSS